MKLPFAILLLAGLLSAAGGASAGEKPRVLVLTDIENEPDDAMSMVRFLVYANQWDVEGLVATTSIHQKSKVAPWRIREIVDAYDKVRNNLELHERGFPSADYLRARIVEGRPEFHGRFAGADYSIVDNPWLHEHIRAKGPLGAQHPLTRFMMEGDTPSFLSLIDNGLKETP